VVKQKIIRRKAVTKKAKSKPRTWKQQKAFQKKKAAAVKRKKIAAKNKQLAKMRLKLKKHDAAKKARLLKIKKAKALKIKKAKAKKAAGTKKRPVKKSAPKVIKKVKVGDLLTNRDEKYMQEKSMSTIAVMIDGERFMCSKQHSVPKNAKIVRDGQGQVTGMKAIGSG